jgi:signal transduction histidine kinase
MKPRSITRRVINIILIAELSAAVALSVLVFFHEESTRVRALDVGIRGRADSLLGAIQDAEDTADNVYVDPTELRLPQGDYWAVFNADGSMVGHSAQRVDWPALLQSGDGLRDTQLDGSTYRLLEHHALRIIDRSETGGVGIRRPVILLYATRKTHILQDSFASASFYILAALVVSLITAALVAFFLRASLHPVVELAAAAGSLSFPLLQFTPPASVEGVTELKPLALALSTTASNLRDAFAREKRFVGDAAHELKTATAVVRSTIQLLMLKSRTPEEYRAGLDRALDDTERLQALIAQMLNLAAAEETGKSESGHADLADTLRAVVDELGPMSQQAGVVLVYKLASGAVVSISPERGRILLVNLLSNAIQYSKPKGEVLISLQLTPHAVLLKIQDHGCGIPAADLPLVFDRFYRADASRARETGGTGLGLAICKTIVDQAGATLEMKSDLGVGTVVTVAFIRA